MRNLLFVPADSARKLERALNCRSGTLDRVSITGDAFAVAPIRGGFREPTSVTRVESTAWVSEGQLAFFFDPARRKLSRSLPFRIYAVP
jgi:hypothetical protein